jgi:NAD(P)H-dependent FMN reductase
MTGKKNIFAIIGSASFNSSNLKLVQKFAGLAQEEFTVTIFDDLKKLSHFDPRQSVENPPKSISKFRENILKADGILICTPEYVFSIPSGLKNAIEWCVSTTVFSQKPTGIITASANGQKGHEELKMIMKTVDAHFNEQTTLLIQGVKSKINEQGIITDAKTEAEFLQFIEAYKSLLNNKVV